MTTSIVNASRFKTEWVTSSHSGGNNNCVQVGTVTGPHTAVRDSKAPGGPALLFGAVAWGGFLEAIRRGGVEATAQEVP